MKRILLSLSSIIVALLLISFITFCLMNASADDPIALKFQLVGADADANLIEVLRAEAGLDKPFLERYFIWLFGILKGDFGKSVFYGSPVKNLMVAALPNTLTLVFSSMLVSMAIVLPLSLYAAFHHNRWADYIIRLLSMMAISLPSFWVGLILMYVFALKLQLLTITNNSGLEGLILPTFTLAIWVSGLYIRRLRATFLEEMNKDYIIGAKALGIKDRTIIRHYLLPNAMLSVLSMLGVTIGGLLGGATIIETIFGWRGIGYLMVQGIISRDYPIMQAYILWAAGIYIIVNFLVDVLINSLLPNYVLKRRDACE